MGLYFVSTIVSTSHLSTTQGLTLFQRWTEFGKSSEQGECNQSLWKWSLVQWPEFEAKVGRWSVVRMGVGGGRGEGRGRGKFSGKKCRLVSMFSLTASFFLVEIIVGETPVLLITLFLGMFVVPNFFAMRLWTYIICNRKKANQCNCNLSNLKKKSLQCDCKGAKNRSQQTYLCQKRHKCGSKWPISGKCHPIMISIIMQLLCKMNFAITMQMQISQKPRK